MNTEWFYSLYNEEKGLFNLFPREEIRAPLLLITSTTGLKKSKRKFCLFESVADFEDYSYSLAKKNRNFYEVIFGEVKQKPHFDIDIAAENEDDDLDKIVEEVIEETIKAFEILGITKDELRWYSSHGVSKRSLHLIIPNYYVKNNIEAKKIYYYLKKTLPQILFQYFDPAVYSLLQNFRILGNCKGEEKKKRYKKLMFREEDDFSLMESLITQVPPNAVEFPYIDIHIQEEYEFTSVEVDSERMTAAVDKVLEYLGNGFRLYNIKNEFMSFMRLQPTHCSICSVVHESIYPFARLLKNGKVYLYCHRSRKYCKDEKKQRIEIFDFGYEHEPWSGSLDDLEPENILDDMKKMVDYSQKLVPEGKEKALLLGRSFPKPPKDPKLYQDSITLNFRDENMKMLFSKGKNKINKCPPNAQKETKKKLKM